jgi:L-fuconolactonase
VQRIIDSHMHFWHPNQLGYSWLAGEPLINRPYLPSDIPQSSEWIIEGVVFVEADVNPGEGLREPEWVASLARDDQRIQGIVAFAPLEQGNAARAHLDQLKDIPLVKSVRRLIQAEPLGFSTQPAFIAGVNLLREYDFRFDICVYHPQLPDVIELVSQCPDITFVLDHVGKPSIKAGLLDPWRDHIKTLAQFPNVHCKISGMVTEADHQNWTPEQLQPYIDHVIDSFGIERVMYGGDWPVALLASSYERWVETVMKAVQSLNEDERNQFFYENARTFYRL